MLKTILDTLNNEVMNTIDNVEVMSSSENSVVVRINKKRGVSKELFLMEAGNVLAKNHGFTFAIVKDGDLSIVANIQK